MKLPRFTVRRLMIAVAIAGVLISQWVDGERERRRKRFKGLARAHPEYSHNLVICSFYRNDYNIDLSRQIKIACRYNQDAIQGLDLEDRDQTYHRMLADKYSWAANHPWLPVTPDPPEPE